MKICIVYVEIFLGVLKHISICLVARNISILSINCDINNYMFYLLFTFVEAGIVLRFLSKHEKLRTLVYHMFSWLNP